MNEARAEEIVWAAIRMVVKAFAILVAILTFLGSWFYFGDEYGLLGIALGWFPALFLAFFAALLSPLLLFGIVMAGAYFLYAYLRHGHI